MPKVPSYDQFTVQPSDAAMPRVTAPDMPVLAGKEAMAIGDGMIKAGTALSAMAEKAAQEADQIRVIDATNAAVKAQLALTYDKDNGFLNLKGEAALKRPDGKPIDVEFTEKLENQFAVIEEGLNNDRQKKLFRQASAGLARQFMGNVNQHMAAEYKEYQVGVLNGSIDVATQKMALDWGKPEVVAEQQRLIAAAAAERDKNLSPEQREANLIKALSPGNSAVVSSAVDAGNTTYAKEYLKQNAAYITPENRLVLSRAVELGDFETRTQTYAEQYIGEAKGDFKLAIDLARKNLSGKDEDRAVERIQARSNEAKQVDAKKVQTEAERIIAANPTVEAQLAAARKELDGELENSVIQKISAMDAEKTVIRERGQKKAREEAFSFFSKSGFSSIPASVLSRMDPEDVDKMRQLQESRNYTRTLQGEANERRRQQNLYKSAAPEFLSLYSDLNKLEKMTPEQIILLEPKFGEQHVRTLLDRNKVLQNEEGKRTAKMDDDQFNAIALKYEMNPFKPSKKQKEVLALVHSRVDMELEAAAKRKRQPLSKEEKEKIMIDALKTEVEIDGLIWNDTKPVIMLTPEEAAKVVIPAAERKEAVEALRSRYKRNPIPENEPTEENIRGLFLEGKGYRK